MAITHLLKIESIKSDVSTTTFKDITEDYGVGANKYRHEVAHKYLAYKLDTSLQGALLSIVSEPNVINDTGESDIDDYVADLIEIPTIVDGVYMLILIEADLWDSGDNYVTGTDLLASIVYYPNTAKFYKALQDNDNIAPDSGSGPANWEEVTDFEEIIDNATITTYRYTDLVAGRIESETRDSLLNGLDGLLCGKCETEDQSRILKLLMGVNALYAANEVELYHIAERGTVFITELLDEESND